MKYYVYHAYGLNGELLYVGKGSGDRYKHCNSGVSSSFHLNEYFFKNGNESIDTKIVREFDCEIEALEYEKVCIQTLKPKFNTVYSPREKMMYNNFTDWSRRYYELHQMQDVDGINELRQLKTDYCIIVDTLGIEDIKSTGFHKTKSKAKYRKVVGIQTISSSKAKSYKHLKLKVGGFYTYSEVKDAIQDCFDKMGVKANAKSTDIKQVFNVKRTTRSGVEGFLIVEKI